MATTNYVLRSKKNPAMIWCRYSNGRAIQLFVPLGISVNPNDWNKKDQQIANKIRIRDRAEVNRKLALLKIEITDRYNLGYIEGETYDNAWLKSIISEHFGRPKGEKNNFNQFHVIYFTDFVVWWLENKYPDWYFGRNGKEVPQKQIRDRTKFNKRVVEFQGKSKLKIRSITNKTIIDLVRFLKDEYGFASNSINAEIAAFKFMLNRAKEEGLKVNESYKIPVNIPPDEKFKYPYLSPLEIDRIYNHDFSDNHELDVARDYLIIAVWTGLRVSDFIKRLNVKNIVDGMIEITNQKTGIDVTIPMHRQFKTILDKHNGRLPLFDKGKGKMPKRMKESEFNKAVKQVCVEVGGFTQLMRGRIQGEASGSDKNLGVINDYPKHKLISSHIGRRSFATNHYGKIPIEDLMSIGGWTNEGTVRHYVQETNREHAEVLEKYWEETYLKKVI